MRRLLLCAASLVLLLVGCGSSDENVLVLNDDIDFVARVTLIDGEVDSNANSVWSGSYNGITYSLVNTDQSVYGGVYELVTNDSSVRVSGADGYYPIDACIDIDGNLYIANVNGIYVFDSNGNIIGSHEDDSISVNSLAVAADGLVYYTYITRMGTSIGYLGRIDSNADAELVYEVDGLIDNGTLRVLGINQGFDDLVIMHKDSIYSVDMDNASTSLMLDMSVAGMDSVDSSSVTSSGDCIYVYGSIGDLFDDSVHESGLYRIEVTYPEIPRTTINLAVFYENRWVQKVTDRFNASNPNYKVVIEYNYDMDPSVFASQCLTDESADMVMSNSEYISLLDGEDVLADLDEVCNFDESTFVSNLWDSMKNSSGVRTWIAPFVAIKGMYTIPGTGLREDSLSSLESMRQYIDSRGQENHIIRYDNDVSLQFLLVESFMAKVYEKGEFSSHEYYDLLMFAEEYGKDNLEETSSVASQLQNGELLFVDSDMGSFLQYLLLSEYFQDSFEYCGRPYNEGLTFSADMFVSVFESSEVKEGCKEFIEFMLRDEYLTCTMANNLYYMPITYSGVQANIDITLDLYANNQITDTQVAFFATDGSASGGMSLPILMQSSGDGSDRIFVDGNSDTDVYHRYTGPTGRRLIDNPEDYVNNYMEFISAAHGFEFIEYDAMVIVNEELDPYRNGQRDAATTSDVTANRVQTVINERG